MTHNNAVVNAKCDPQRSGIQAIHQPIHIGGCARVCMDIKIVQV